jgi:hypothetical protein
MAFVNYLYDAKSEMLKCNVAKCLLDKGYKVIWTPPYCPGLQPIQFNLTASQKGWNFDVSPTNQAAIYCFKICSDGMTSSIDKNNCIKILYNQLYCISFIFMLIAFASDEAPKQPKCTSLACTPVYGRSRWLCRQGGTWVKEGGSHG